ncbi:hypothetical protein J6590_034784 [Homalodisca vitripennis]|nr:hypothetical protein J6590_034784 [Homalodisca vitripennis]
MTRHRLKFCMQPLRNPSCRLRGVAYSYFDNNRGREGRGCKGNLSPSVQTQIRRMSLIGPDLHQSKLIWEEIGETGPDKLENNIKLLKEWISCQPHLPKNYDERMLPLVVRGCKHNLERAKVKVDTYYSVRGSVPEIFQSRVADITLLMVVCTDERMLPLVVRGCKHNLERAKVNVDTYYSVRGSMPEIFQSRVADITLLMVVCSDERMLPLVVRGCKHNLERAKVKLDTYYSVRGSVPEIFQSRVADITLLMVVCTDERMLPLVVRGCKHNLERAKVKVDTYYSVRGSVPEIFQSRVADITLLMVVCTDERMCRWSSEAANTTLKERRSKLTHTTVCGAPCLRYSNQDERMMPLVVRGCKHNLERAKVKVDTYYSVRGSMPEIFQSRVADIILLMVVCTDERMLPLVVRGCKHNLERAKV